MPILPSSRQSDDRVAFDMSAETAAKALDLVFRSPSPALKIEFQGANPYLTSPLIRTIVEAAKEMESGAQRDLQFVITTNLALLSDEVLEFCKVHGVLVSTSLMARRPAQREPSRPGRDSYERTIEGIRRVREALGSDGVGALMTRREPALAGP